MITLENLSKELSFNQIDEVVGGLWTTTGGDSGGDDFYGATISVNGMTVRIGFTLTFT